MPYNPSIRIACQAWLVNRRDDGNLQGSTTPRSTDNIVSVGLHSEKQALADIAYMVQPILSECTAQSIGRRADARDEAVSVSH